jgi:hypothetical protein
MLKPYVYRNVYQMRIKKKDGVYLCAPLMGSSLSIFPANPQVEGHIPFMECPRPLEHLLESGRWPVHEVLWTGWRRGGKAMHHFFQNFIFSSILGSQQN